MIERESERGNLVVPNDAKVIWSEPQIRFCVKKNGAFLFDSPPKSTLKSYKDNRGFWGSYRKVEERVVDNTVKKVVTYTNKATKKSETLIASVQLKIGQEVLARPFASNPFAFQVCIFERVGKKSADRPESGNEVKIIKEGYMFKEHLISSNENLVNFNENIFPESPKIGHIRQSDNLGDCFLLSSLISILKQKYGHEFIQNMMIQNDQVTIVRFYHPDTLQPIYVSVNNSYFSMDGQKAVHHEALWVHMLEKAYAGLGYKFEANKAVMSSQSFLNIYGSGGNPTMALKILTGQKSDTLFICRQAMPPWNKEDANIAMNIAERDQLDPLATDISIKSLKDNKIPISLALDKDAMLQWGNFLLDLLNRQPAKYDELEKFLEYNDRVLLDLDQVVDIINELELKFNAPKEVIQGFKYYAFSEKNFTGILGSGDYNAQQCDLFEKIKAANEKDCLLVANTCKKFNGSEELIPGLSREHVYAIVGTVEKKVNHADLKFIKIANPWGNTGRVYDWNAVVNYNKNAIVVDEGAAIFDIELSEFVRYFEHVSVGEPLPTPQVQLNLNLTP